MQAGHAAGGRACSRRTWMQAGRQGGREAGRQGGREAGRDPSGAEVLEAPWAEENFWPELIGAEGATENF